MRVVDAIIECTGVQAAVDDAAMGSKYGAIIVLVGAVTFVNIIMSSKELTVKGSWVFTEDEYDMTLSMITKGALKVQYFANSTVALDGVTR